MAMIKVQSFTFNDFQENTFVLSDQTKECVVIDPGCYTRAEKATLQAYIAREGLKVVVVANTHCHIDHVLGNYFVKETYKVPLLIPLLEVDMLRMSVVRAPVFGFNAYEESTADQFLGETGQLTFGQSALEIRFVPGHSPGHLAFYSAADGFCIGGDVLFRGSVGRTDLPGGNADTLFHSIRTQLYTLPEATVVYCGHGEPTTIGREKATNPYVRA
jgi:hydroxyacylglutathione hydrolase